MRTILSFLTILLFTACSSTNSIIKIPANQSVDISTENYEYSKVKLQNRSASQVDVKVIDKKSGEFIRGFGLGPIGSTHVSVEDFGQLKLINNSASTIKVGYSVFEKIKTKKTKKAIVSKPKEKKKSSTTQIYLTNKTAKSIPLIIPTVMNPNLSPFSKSGVSLKMGQKVFFKNKRKRYLLFEMNETNEAEQIIEVSELIKMRKKELGLK